ncbi:MAG: DUF370 domain-containing protein [Ruminococcaceae bacterium]|nr:DUF370 domain-containing protein [Oscillospiraceae bacterium]
MKTNPYINVGGTQILAKSDILGIFDLDTASTKTDTKRFLSKCESEGHLIMVGNDIPKSFVLTASGRKEHVYMTQLSVSSIEGRWKRKNAHL